MKKLILCNIIILCSMLTLAANTTPVDEEAVTTIKEYIELLDQKNTQKLLKKTPLTKKQLDEFITLADAHLLAQINNQGTAPIVDALEDTQKLYIAIQFGAAGYLLGKFWLWWWPEDGLLSINPELLILHIYAACYLYLLYVVFRENAQGLFTLLQRLVNRGELKKARAIKKILLARREHQLEMESI